jgi:penicillin-binding protein 1A
VTQPYIYTGWRIAAALVVAVVGGVSIAVAGAQEYLEPDLPDVAALRDVRLQVPLRIYSRDGRLMGQFGETRRTPLSIEAIPPQLIQAVLAAEDDGYYEHSGVDVFGLARALLRNVLSGRKGEGGSTITMQLTRGVFFTPEKSARRKLLEIFLALRIEQQFSKDEILGLYLNKSFLGQRAYGVGAAAEVYFGKKVDELTIPEMALIAGTFRLPSRDNPVANPELARQRRSYVLRRMREKNFISAAEYESALAAAVESKLHGPAIELEAPYVAEMVRLELQNRVGPQAFTDGYVAVTTVDSRLQRAAVQAAREGLIEYDQRHGYRGPAARVVLPQDAKAKDLEQALDDYPSPGGLEPAIVLEVSEQNATAYVRLHGRVSLAFNTMRWARPALADGNVGKQVERPSDVVQVGDVIYVAQDVGNAWHFLQIPAAQSAFVGMDPTDGAISALVGGFDYNASNFNRAWQAKRQPGSSIKPLLYSAALEHGFTPATLINDAPVEIDDPWSEGRVRPQNYNRTSMGPVRMREAMYRSLNQVSYRIIQAIGPAYAAEHMQHFGLLPEELPQIQSLAVGTNLLSPSRMASAYSVFANGGYLVEPYFIDRIEDPNGAVVYTASPKYACTNCVRAGAAPSSGASPPSDRNDAIPADVPTDEAPIPNSVAARRTLSAQNAYIMTDMMMDVVRRGTATGAQVLKRNDLAGKTGTTQDGRDTWFCGFNADLVAVAWVGFDQERSLGPREEGGRTALPIWIKFMAEALKGKPDHRLPTPPGLETRLVSSATGKPARPGDTNAIFEIFMADNLPDSEPADSNEVAPNELPADKDKTDDSLF